jgi:hypothetical protein
MAQFLSETAHYVKGIDPVADAFSGTAATDIVNAEAYHKTQFIMYTGAGVTGTSVLTVQACSDVSASATTAVPFRYRAITSDDTQGALTAATTSGFTTTAGASQIYVVEVDNDELAATGYGYVRLVATESADAPQLGCVLIQQYEARYAQDVTQSSIT